MALQSTGSPARDEGAFLSFTMTDSDRVVRCHVQRGALDSIARDRMGGLDDALECFRRFRAVFEAAARDLHDAGLPVRITADHVSWLRRSPIFGRQALA